MTKICKFCQKKYKTTSKISNFCSNKCRSLNSYKDDPLIKTFKNIKEISEIPIETLKVLHHKDLYELSKRLKKHNLPEILEKYRDFRKKTKLCKNCNGFYNSSNSKCPFCGTGKAYNPNHYIEKSRNQSKIYQALKDFKRFEDIPEGLLKVLRQHDRNQVLSQAQKYLPLLYEELKEHWDTFRICPNCGEFFRRLKTGHNNYECCPNISCQGVYTKTINIRNDKIRESCLKKFGVNWYSKTPEFVERAKDFNPFYDYSWQLQNIKKVQENAGGYEKWLQRQKENSVKFQNSLTEEQRQNIREKREQTTLEKFGVKNVFELVEKQSKSETRFLNEYEIKNNVKVTRQYKVGRMFVDGFIEPNIIIEFLGDYWHGYKNNDELNEKVGKTFKELNTETFKRFKDLKSQGYKVFYIWETDYKTQGLGGLKEYE